MNIQPEEVTLSKLALEYSDEDKARTLLESWIWPKGPVCPHCQSKDACRLQGKATRAGVLKCRDCSKQFTVTVGTIFERSKIPISKWMMAVFILSSSKKGVSAHQLHRMLGVTYKTAWFIFHRLRHAMKQGPLAEAMTGVVEVDDAYIGGTPERGQGTSGRGTKHKTPVVALVERGGNAKLQVVAGVSAKNLRQVVKETVAVTANVHTDQWNGYRPLFREFKHDVVKHSVGEFSRTDADGFFGECVSGVSLTFSSDTEPTNQDSKKGRDSTSDNFPDDFGGWGFHLSAFMFGALMGALLIFKTPIHKWFY
jgi:transposase-like protein